jgi:cytochrome P450
MSAPTEAKNEAPASCPVHHGFEPFQQKDPFSAYASLRAEEPVMYDERIDCWVVTRYDDIKAVFGDWESFSSENAQAPVRGRGPKASKIMADGGFTAYSGLSARVPPEHTRIRNVVSKAFTPRRYKVLEPAIRQNVVTLLQGLLAREQHTGDVVRDLADDIPTITILTLIGADTSQVETYKRWSDSRAAMTWGDLSDEEQVPHAHNVVEYWQECMRLVQDAHQNERDSLVADLVRAQQEGDPITDHEIASACYSLLFAGHETTTTLISNSLRMLLAHPDQWQQIVEDPTRIGPAIDEVLRYSPSIIAWRRKATVDATIGGTAVPKGANVLLVMGSANRDATKFEDADTFDIGRENAREHLAFGFGIHYCLGNMLAKLQAKVAIEETARMAPNLRLVDAAAIEFADNLSFRAPVAVPVRWDGVNTESNKYIQFFDGGLPPEHDLLGGKCASLVSMTAAGMPVPPGFAVTTALFDAFVEQTGLGQTIANLLSSLDVDDVASVDEVSAKLRQEICSRPVPQELRAQTLAAYDALQSRFESEVPVAVRSSATAEDLPDASFAGQQDTYLWLTGVDSVLEHIRLCWASLYTSRAIMYRLKNGISDDGLSTAVAVQKMVNARTSGVAITMNPATGDRSKITIEASYGLGEMVVSGQVTPDNIVVDKVILTVVKETIGDKHAELVPDVDAMSLVEREVDEDRRGRRCLSADELTAVAVMAKRAEQHYKCPQDIEWAIDADLPDGENLLLLQSRPETVHSSKPATSETAPAGRPTSAFGLSSMSLSLLAGIQSKP